MWFNMIDSVLSLVGLRNPEFTLVSVSNKSLTYYSSHFDLSPLTWEEFSLLSLFLGLLQI